METNEDKLFYTRSIILILLFGLMVLLIPVDGGAETTVDSGATPVVDSGLSEVDFEIMLDQEVDYKQRVEAFRDNLSESDLAQKAENQLALVSIGLRIRYLELIFELESNECFDSEGAKKKDCTRIERTREKLAKGLGYLSTITSMAAGSAAAKLTYGKFRNLFNIDYNLRPVRLKLTTTKGIKDVVTMGAIWVATAYTSATATYNAYEIHFMPEEKRRELLNELKTARMALQWVDVSSLRETLVAWQGKVSDAVIEQAVVAYEEASVGGNP